MRRYDRQLLIRTDQEGIDTLNKYCEDRGISKVVLLEEILQEIKEGKR